MVLLVQKELDVFRETVWNTHRIRAQKDTYLPVGVPNHIHNLPINMDLNNVVGTQLYIVLKVYCHTEIPSLHPLHVLLCIVLFRPPNGRKHLHFIPGFIDVKNRYM